MTRGKKMKEDSLQQKLERIMLTERLHGAIKELYAKGTSKRAIARLLNIDQGSTSSVKKAEWIPYQTPPVGSCLLDPCKDWLMGRMEEVGYNARILLRE